MLGVTPPWHSAGGSRRTGSTIRAGNRYARNLPVEATWCYRDAAAQQVAPTCLSAPPPLGAPAGICATAAQIANAMAPFESLPFWVSLNVPRLRRPRPATQAS
uniref:hypothetical protein n=1 Tax=Variovorax saccharolyticus TaxID=3053516 RepID=UPI00336A2155